MRPLLPVRAARVVKAGAVCGGLFGALMGFLHMDIFLFMPNAVAVWLLAVARLRKPGSPDSPHGGNDIK